MNPEIGNSGNKKWYDEKGKLHRENGPAVEYVNSYKAWYQHNKLHCEGGPAVEYANGRKDWYKKGLLHREDGPAIEYANGHKEWWYAGEQLPPCVQTVEQLKSYIRNKILW